MTKCSIPSCGETGALQLQGHGYPRNVKDTYWFCLMHAVEYRALGYKDYPLREAA